MSEEMSNEFGRTLVTGGAGFIGSAAAALLVENQCDVVVLDNLVTGDISQVPEGVEFVEGDISDISLLKKMGSFDTCLHFAGLIDTAESTSHPEMYFQENHIKTMSLVDTLVDRGISKFCFSSTCAIYKSTLSPLSEDSEFGPSSPYGQSKLLVEMYLKEIASDRGIAIGVLRYFNAAGSFRGKKENHKRESHLIPLAIDALINQIPFSVFGNDYDTADGTCVRDYIHIEDLANAHVEFIPFLARGECRDFNLGSGVGYSVLEVIAELESISELKLEVKFADRREGDSPYLVSNNKKFKETFDWQPNRSTLNKIISDAYRSRI